MREEKRGPERWSSHLGPAFGSYHPPAVALLVNDALRWVVDRLVQVSTAVAHILNGVARTRGEEAGGRARSRSSLFFFLSFALRSFSPSGLTFVAVLTRLHRPARAQTSCSACPWYIGGGTRLSGLLDSPPLIDVTHPETRSERGAPHAQRSGMRKREKERARDTAKSWTAIADAAHEIRRSGCCGCCPSFAMLDGGCGWRYTAPMVPHWTTAGGPWENMPHVAFNAQVRRSSTAGGRNSLARTLDKKFQIATSNKLSLKSRTFLKSLPQMSGKIYIQGNKIFLIFSEWLRVKC